MRHRGNELLSGYGVRLLFLFLVDAVALDAVAVVVAVSKVSC